MAGDALALALREPTLGIVECESGARQALVLVQDELLQAPAKWLPLSSAGVRFLMNVKKSLLF
jgi:hypothetical protein